MTAAKLPRRWAAAQKRQGEARLADASGSGQLDEQADRQATKVGGRRLQARTAMLRCRVHANTAH
jgi:hypothetical protein